MPRPQTRTKPPARTKSVRTTGPTPVTEVSPTPPGGWPEVLTLVEAAAYLRVPEAEVVRIADSQGLPGRRIGSEWRFSRAAIQDWLRRPSMKDRLLQLAGSWKDNPDVEEMLAEIYRQRGRPMTEESR
jgi:excisionase family DNA binding protein